MSDSQVFKLKQQLKAEKEKVALLRDQLKNAIGDRKTFQEKMQQIHGWWKKSEANCATLQKRVTELENN